MIADSRREVQTPPNNPSRAKREMDPQAGFSSREPFGLMGRISQNIAFLQVAALVMAITVSKAAEPNLPPTSPTPARPLTFRDPANRDLAGGSWWRFPVHGSDNHP